MKFHQCYQAPYINTEHLLLCRLVRLKILLFLIMVAKAKCLIFNSLKLKTRLPDNEIMRTLLTIQAFNTEILRRQAFILGYDTRHAR